MAKGSKKKKTRARASTKKKSSRAKSRQPTAVRLGRLVVDQLATPFHVRHYAGLIQDADVLASSAAVATDVREIELTKSDDSPANVRVTFDIHEEVLIPGKKHGIAKPRPVNTWVSALIEVLGNGTATIKVENALPDTILVPVPPGQTGTWATKPLFVK